MTVLHLLMRRWAPDVLLALDGGPRNFNRLLEIPGISDRVLTCRLRELEDEHLISRDVLAGPPVRVRYGLTGAGRRLVAPLQQLLAVASTTGLEEVAAAS